MQWLNKVDEALDWVLGPVEGEGGNINVNGADGNDNADGGGDADAINAAARASIDAGNNDNGNDDDDGNNNGRREQPSSAIIVSSSSSSRIPPLPVRLKPPSSTSAQHQNQPSASGHGTFAKALHENLTVKKNNEPRLPPPPPPPPLPSKKNTATPPRPTQAEAKRVKPSISILPPPDTTCPSTPLVAMAGEFLVLDESPHPVAIASSDGNNNFISHINDECEEDESINCQPPDSIFAEETEEIIREEAEATATNQQAAENTAQQESIGLPHISERSEELIAINKQAPAKEVAISTEEQAPLMMSQMQDFARASPAPTKVTIGDRGRRSNANTNEDEKYDGHVQMRKMPIPPPPPITSHANANTQNRRLEPPSPSTFVIQVPSAAQQSSATDGHLPINRLHIPPPPLAPHSSNSWSNNMAMTPATPHRVTHPQQHAPRTSARANVTPRPTPGVIRRRIRDPSLSPEESLEASLSFSDGGRDDSKNPMDGNDDAKRSIPPPPPPLPFIPPMMEVTTLSSSSSSKPDTIAFHEEVTPFIDNRKTAKSGEQEKQQQPINRAAKTNLVDKALDLVLGPVLVHSDGSKNDSTATDADVDSKAGMKESTHKRAPSTNSLPPANQVDKALDWVLGPVESAPNDGNDDVDVVDVHINTRGREQISHGAKNDATEDHTDTGHNVNESKDDAGQETDTHINTCNDAIDGEASQEKEEPIAEAITGWFQRLGSTDGGGAQMNHEVKNDANNDGDDADNKANENKDEAGQETEPITDAITGWFHRMGSTDEDDDADTGDNANEKKDEAGRETEEEPITDAITGWFHRMGSTDGEGQMKKDSKKKGRDDDDHDGSSSDDSFHSQDSNNSELTDELDDFAIPSPSFSQVQEDDNQSWDPSLNRYGFVHVRLLRAQRLPCASGSSINVNLSLQPWKGRIRIPAHATINGPKGAGVCLRWDRPSEQKRGGGGSKSKASGSKAGDGESSLEVDLCSHSMVHAYNNEDTPVPTILLELSISSLGASLGGVFDRFLCSVTIPCHDLLHSPRSWRHKWHPASLVQGDGHKTGEEDVDIMENAPLILLETCFEPKVTRATVSTLSKQIILDKKEQELTTLEEEEEDQYDITGEDSDTLGSIPHIIRPNQSMQDDESMVSKSSTLTPALIPRHTVVTKSHLLRVRSFWTPTWCAVCSKPITTGWTLQGKNFECEACHIFCCRDCQLQVDARIPCGSELAVIAVKKAAQYQVPSMSHIMTTMAPMLDSAKAGMGLGDGTEVTEPDTIGSDHMLQHHDGKSIEGIGIMNIRVLRACLFEKSFPSEADPDEVFKSDFNLRIDGDHYVRVSWLDSKESKRTKTVLQTSKPVFDSEDMVFDVPHYGMEYKLEVVDSNTDKPIGTCLLSAQGLLQWQRDDMLAKKDHLLRSFFHLRNASEPQRVKLALRTGVKDGFGLNFYNSSKVAGGSGKRAGKETSQRPGEISGWLELDVHLEEDRQLFYSPTPRRCPPRADEEFDIALIQLHIARIGALIEGISGLVSAYFYVVSWENPKITGVSMVTFVVLTLRFNLEYLGALPIGCLVLYMAYLAYLRVNGHFKDRWTLKEKEALIKSETKIEKNQSIFRPVGVLQVGDLQGKHLRSKELGLPGSFYASILYDPLRYADEKVKSSLIKIDTSSGCSHEVGATVSPGITSNPRWTHVQESPELMRLKHLLPDDRLWRQENDEVDSLSYPILQPITENWVSESDDVDKSQSTTGVQLMPWEYSYGAVVVQVKFSDVLGSFQMFDNVLGEVVIPLAKLAGSGREVEGWFRLLNVGTKETVPGEAPEDSAIASDKHTGWEEDHTAPAAPQFPEVYLKVKFSANTSRQRSGDSSLSDDMESSKVICEEIIRTASIAQDNSIGVIGSSLNTINTVRTLGGKLQNQISFVVDMLERVRNAFNFSNPRITVFVLLALTALWIVLALIPTRIVVLVGGLAQFGATFYTHYIAKPTTKKTKPKEKKAEEGLESSSAIGNPLENLFLSIPTDEDLRRTYFWEARRLGEKEREKFAIAKRQTRLEKLWKAKWHGALELKEKKSEHHHHHQPDSPSSSTRNWSWEPAFALIEGHRFIWWRSEKAFDTGEAPLGQIYFAGHSGLAGLSPLDLRELSQEEIPFVVSVFGRGLKGQQKITLLAPSSNIKDGLENAVLGASMDAKAD